MTKQFAELSQSELHAMHQHTERALIEYCKANDINALRKDKSHDLAVAVHNAFAYSHQAAATALHKERLQGEKK